MSSISHFKKKMSSSQIDPANEKKKDDKKMELIKPVSLYIMCIYPARRLVADVSNPCLNITFHQRFFSLGQTKASIRD